MATISSSKLWEDAVLDYMQTYDISDIQNMDAGARERIAQNATELTGHCSSAVCKNFAYLFTSATMLQDALLRQDHLQLSETKAQERKEDAYAVNEGLKEYLKSVEKKRVLLKTAIDECQTKLADAETARVDLTRELELLATNTTEAGQAGREALTQAIDTAESEARRCASDKGQLQQELGDLNAQIQQQQQQHAVAKDDCKAATDAKDVELAQSAALQYEAKTQLEQKQNEVQNFITEVSSARTAGYMRQNMTLREAIQTVVNQKEKELLDAAVSDKAAMKEKFETQRDRVKLLLDQARVSAQTKQAEAKEAMQQAEEQLKQAHAEAKDIQDVATAALDRANKTAEDQLERARDESEDIQARALQAQALQIGADYHDKIKNAKAQAKTAKAQATACAAQLELCENKCLEKGWKNTKNTKNTRAGATTRSQNK